MKKNLNTVIPLSRRDLLKWILAASGSAMLGNKASAARLPAITRTIASSSETIPVVGLGTSRTFNVGTSADERAAIKEVLKLFVTNGGSIVDSSPMYGEAERVVGDLSVELKIQDKLFLATKVWTEGRDAGIEQMKTSMRLLHTNKIDLMQVHNLVDTKTHLKTLRDWKEKGLIRYIGITHYRVDAHAALAKVIRKEPLDFVQFNYSIVTRDAEQTLLPLCRDRGVATMINRPYERGALFAKVNGQELPEWAQEFDCSSWGQFFLKFILSHPDVTTIIPATSKTKHLLDNMQAGVGRLPDTTTRERMAKFVMEF